MFQNVFGDATWLKSLRYYLSSKLNKTATSDDFYKSLQQAVDEDFLGNTQSIETIMKSWESLVGYSIVTVTQSGAQLRFEQSQFSTDKPSGNLWIPISYTLGSNPNFSDLKTDFWIKGSKSATIFTNQEASKPFSDWIIVNVQQTSFYRVNYGLNLWNRIITQLKRDFGKIHRLNRAQLIDDSSHLAEAELISFEVPLGIMSYLENEVNYAPWASANRVQGTIKQNILGSKIHQRFQEFMQKNVQKVFNNFGTKIIENEPRTDRLLREISINVACKYQLESCLTKTLQDLQNMLESSVELPPDVKSSIFCNGIRTADRNTFFQLQTKMLQSKDVRERAQIIEGLSCTQNESYLTNLLFFAIDTDVSISNEERSLIFLSSVERSEISIHIIIKFIRENRLTIENNLITKLCFEISLKIFNQETLVKFELLLNVLQEFRHISQDHIENYRMNANVIFDWQTRNLIEFEKFFDKIDRTSTTEKKTSTTDRSRDTTLVTDQSTTLGSVNVLLSLTVLTFSIFIIVLF
jgi:aminopeptidase N